MRQVIRPYSRGLRFSVVVLILVTGAIIGSGISEALADFIPILGNAARLGVRMDEVSLAGVITFGLNFQLKVNLGTAVGLIVAAWLLRGR